MSYVTVFMILWPYFTFHMELGRETLRASMVEDSERRFILLDALIPYPSKVIH